MVSYYCVDYEVRDERMVYRMPVELDDHVARELREKMDVLIDAYGVQELVLDFGKTKFMDSSGVGVIIGRCRKMGFGNGIVYVKNCSDYMKKLLLVSGLNRILQEEV